MWVTTFDLLIQIGMVSTPQVIQVAEKGIKDERMKHQDRRRKKRETSALSQIKRDQTKWEDKIC